MKRGGLFVFEIPQMSSGSSMTVIEAAEVEITGSKTWRRPNPTFSGAMRAIEIRLARNEDGDDIHWPE